MPSAQEGPTMNSTERLAWMEEVAADVILDLAAGDKMVADDFLFNTRVQWGTDYPDEAWAVFLWREVALLQEWWSALEEEDEPVSLTTIFSHTGEVESNAIVSPGVPSATPVKPVQGVEG